MNKELFCKSLVVLTEQFLLDNPHHRDYTNIQQYTDITNVLAVYEQYEKLISHTHGDVLDVGSGVGFAKHINPAILTTNLTNDYFYSMEKALNVKKDYWCSNCITNPKWIQTPKQFDYVILHRFLPWNGETLAPEVRYNMLSGVHNVLRDGGTLLYTPINAKAVNVEGWSLMNSTALPTFIITKKQIYNELYPAPT